MLRVTHYRPRWGKRCRHCGEKVDLWAVEFEGRKISGFCAECMERLGLTIRTWAHKRKAPPG